MKAKVLELVKELGFKDIYTSDLYGVKDASVHGAKENWRIWARVTGKGLKVEVTSELYGTEIATLYFSTGELPDLRLRKYTPELLELARSFGAVAGCKI